MSGGIGGPVVGLVAGLGFRRGAPAAALRDALALALMPGGAAPVALATPADKANDPALAELAATLGLPVIAIGAGRLAGTATLTQSARVAGMRGTGSVAEACALLAAGEGAVLLAPRVVSSCRRATAALARPPHAGAAP